MKTGIHSGEKFLTAFELRRNAIDTKSKNDLNIMQKNSRDNYSKADKLRTPRNLILINTPREEHAKILGVKEVPDALTMTGNTRIFPTTRTSPPKEVYTNPAPDDNPYMNTPNKIKIQRGKMI